MKLANLLLRYRATFERKYAQAITPAMRRAMDAVQACRTERYGKIQLRCPQCQALAEHYHSCGHRSCPACQHFDTGQWLERQSQKLLPVDYYMATFTLPQQWRALAWHHQRKLYSLLFDCAISTLKTFGLNDKAMGGDLGLTAVLHTHSRQLAFHPHVHIIVPGGCYLRARRQWKKRRGRYLFNEFNLAAVFRARCLDALVKTHFIIPVNTPKQWVVHCKRVGKGLPALQYLSRYLYRGVISENHIIKDDGSQVTFQYRDSQSKSFRPQCLKGEDFLWLVFQHVLPKGFRRVRDYGFLHGNATQIRQLIQLVFGVLLPEPLVHSRPAFICRQCLCAMNVIAFIRPLLPDW